jgi:hypothetical protein
MTQFVPLSLVLSHKGREGMGFIHEPSSGVEVILIADRGEPVEPRDDLSRSSVIFESVASRRSGEGWQLNLEVSPAFGRPQGSPLQYKVSFLRKQESTQLETIDTRMHRANRFPNMLQCMKV